MRERTQTTAEDTLKGKGDTRSGQRMKESFQPGNPLVGHISGLRRTAGNQAMQKLFKSGVVQAKLKIGAPDDIYEQEADRVAEQVMRMPDTAVSGWRSAFSQGNESIQMKPG